MKTDLQLAKLFKSIDEWETIGTDTQFSIIEERDETIIIFDASNSKKDWHINLNFPKFPYKKMDLKFMVHRGFLEEWQLIQDYFTDYFWRNLEMGYGLLPVTIVGWSYGGAIATLCTETLWHNFPILRDNLRMVTFGAPRVFGFLNFRKIRERWSNSTLYRNGSDIVTMIPFIFMGFRHVRKITNIGPKRTLFGYFKPKKYHYIDGYIESLEGYVSWQHQNQSAHTA